MGEKKDSQETGMKKEEITIARTISQSTIILAKKGKPHEI
jgi:hypothetical protein